MTDPTRVVDQWGTTAVTPMPPGWVNIYREADGSIVTEPCPAILLQEHRQDAVCYDTPNDDGTFTLRTYDRPCSEPYETRAVCAYIEVHGYLEAALTIANYVGTFGPGEDAETFAKVNS